MKRVGGRFRMPDKKRIVKMGETVIRIRNLCEVKTQELARL